MAIVSRERSSVSDPIPTRSGGLRVVEDSLLVLVGHTIGSRCCIQLDGSCRSCEGVRVMSHFLEVVGITSVRLGREMMLRCQPVAEIEVLAGMPDSLQRRPIGVAGNSRRTRPDGSLVAGLHLLPSRGSKSAFLSSPLGKQSRRALRALLGGRPDLNEVALFPKPLQV